MPNIYGVNKAELTFTSQGGGALRYDGTILNVTDPRASLCNKHRYYRIYYNYCTQNKVFYNGICGACPGLCGGIKWTRWNYGVVVESFRVNGMDLRGQNGGCLTLAESDFMPGMIHACEKN